MSFKLAADETLGMGLRRVACQQIENLRLRQAERRRTAGLRPFTRHASI